MRKTYLVGIALVTLLIGGYLMLNRISDQTAALPKVSIGMVTFPGYAPLFVAKEKGFFEGIDLELKTIESIGDMRAAMISGDINMYAATYDIYQSTKDVAPIGTGFLIIDESHGADGLATTAEIKSAKDLRGKKVAAEPGFPPYLVLQYLLDKEGMTLKDLDFQDMPTIDASNAFAAGKLAAAGIYEPALSASVNARPGSKVFASSANLSGLVQDLIFADEKLAKNNPEILKSVADGYFKALDFIESNHDEAYTIMAKAYGVSVKEMEEFKSGVTWTSKSENIKLFDKTSDVNAYKTYDLVCNILKKNGDTNICLKPENKLTNEIINQFK